MPTTADRIDRALVVARGLMTDEAPGLLTLTHVAEYVAAEPLQQKESS